MQRNTLLVLAGAAALIIVAALTLDISAIVHHLAHAAQQLRDFPRAHRSEAGRRWPMLTRTPRGRRTVRTGYA